MNKRHLSLMTLAAAALLAGCAAALPAPQATATLVPTRGNAATGSVTFTQVGDKVLVRGQISGLKPGAEHGFHVHEKGDCSSGDGMSTGGHFNPLAKVHGHHDAADHHSGDLRSVQADAAGNAVFSYESSGVSVGSGATDITGKGLIVHRDPDDYKTQPTGNAGPRIACAVIVRG